GRFENRLLVVQALLGLPLDVGAGQPPRCRIGGALPRDEDQPPECHARRVRADRRGQIRGAYGRVLTCLLHPTSSSIGREASADHSLHEPGYSFAPCIPACSIARRLWHAVTPEPQ